ncbi:DCC family protein, chloroplastic [Ananas comosus]|uniref:DCC family protein, chloroplastic n=1 Tax=Ananas comosus TaxID=4615 RepID=A0A199V5J2_ANACO|nr:DCC family protein, chloroplastic [Ananas comosus]
MAVAFLPACQQPRSGITNPVRVTRTRTRTSPRPVRLRRRSAAAASSASGADWVKATDAAEFFQTDCRPIMLFDGVCNLCNGGVRFVRDNDPNRCLRSLPTSFAPAALNALQFLGSIDLRVINNVSVSSRRIRYEPLQSAAGRKLLQRSGRSPDDISSVVLVEKDRSYIKSEAVLRIMECLELPFPQLAFMLKMVPLLVRDFAYDNVANNRYAIFGRSETDSCEIL